jgi:hypothetical protein
VALKHRHKLCSEIRGSRGSEDVHVGLVGRNAIWTCIYCLFNVDFSSSDCIPSNEMVIREL